MMTCSSVSMKSLKIAKALSLRDFCFSKELKFPINYKFQEKE